MSTTVTTLGVRVASLPDLGAVTDGSSVVGERAGSGRFAATALKSYLSAGFADATGTAAALAAETAARTLGQTLTSIKQYGVIGDGVTDDTVNFNLALADCATKGKTPFIPAGTYMVRDQGAGTGLYCLLNTGASLIGEGRNTSIIVPMSTTSATADILKVKPPAGNEDFLSLQHFMINPGGSGSIKGKRAIYLDANASTSVSDLHIADIYCAPGNDYSLYMDNAPATNLQGVPANSVVECCYFAEGTRWVSTGDSVTIRNCVMRSTAGSARSGVYALIQTGGGGTASHFIVEKCNMDCAGAAVWIQNGRNVKIRDNNIESSFGVGSSSRALIDIDGTSGAVVMPEIKSNGLGIFGTSTVANAIRVNAAFEADIDNNTIIAGFAVSCAILLTSNANNTHVGLNEIQSTFTTPVNNAGVGTRGVRVPLIPINGFANVASGFALAGYWQTKDGVVIMEGLLSCPATPNGLVIFTLPAAASPPLARNMPAYALVGLVVTPQGFGISASGVVTFQGLNTTSQVALDGITFPTVTGVVGSS
jgi:hypothetical protein